MRIGTYSIRAELQGFSAAIAENVAVTVNARQRVDLTMRVGDIGETVVVTGAARLNKTNFGAPTGNRSSTAFGTIRSLSTTPRQVQLGVKVDFQTTRQSLVDNRPSQSSIAVVSSSRRFEARVPVGGPPVDEAQRDCRLWTGTDDWN